MEFELRLATVEDAAAIADVNVRAWRETYRTVLSAGFLSRLSALDTEARWRNRLGDDQQIHVATIDGDIVGYSGAGIPLSREKPRDLELYMIYLLASAHGQGVGQALLDAAIGERPAFLWVAELNPRAIAFYRRNGFEPDGTRAIEPHLEDLAEIRLVR